MRSQKAFCGSIGYMVMGRRKAKGERRTKIIYESYQGRKRRSGEREKKLEYEKVHDDGEEGWCCLFAIGY